VPLAGVVLAVAACSSSGSSAPQGGPAASSTAGASTSASGTPVKGGTMQVAFQSDPDTFDPQVCYDATCWDNMQMLFDRLYDYQGATTDLEAEAAASTRSTAASCSSWSTARAPRRPASSRPASRATPARTWSTRSTSPRPSSC